MTYKKILPLFSIVALIIISCSSTKGVTTPDETRRMMDDRRFTFIAKSVFPTEDARYSPRNLFPNGSNLYQLNSYYDVKVTPDSVVAYLPFFGRSYSAPIDPTEGGIKFTSTDFSYRESMNKGNYEIEILPRDTRDVRNLFFSISPNGYVSLRVISTNRTAISYNGELEGSKYR